MELKYCKSHRVVRAAVGIVLLIVLGWAIHQVDTNRWGKPKLYAIEPVAKSLREVAQTALGPHAPHRLSHFPAVRRENLFVPSAKELQQRPASGAQAAALAFLQEKETIYFQPEDFLQEWLGYNEQLVTELADLLTLSPQEPSDHALLRDAAPPDVFERMAAIDILEHASASVDSPTTARAAQGSLALIIRSTLPRNLGHRKKHIMVGEKYDALAALTRVAPKSAMTAFLALPSNAQRDALVPAIKTALLDRGTTRGHVDQEFHELLEATNRDLRLP